MTSVQEQKIESLKGYSTRYELVISRGEVAYRICYTSRKGRTSLFNSCAGVAAELARITGKGDIHFGKRVCDGAMMGEWTIRFSGRTQREAILAGELPYVGSTRPS